MKDQKIALESHYNVVRRLILAKQHPITGLLPASTAITIHGNYTDAWVRDNVYSILAVWGLGLAYRKANVLPQRAFELEGATIRLMRGLLRAMMRQSEKVERFKSSLALHDALHAKYDTQTGSTVVGDHEWGHLQIDATSLFLLMLAQMTASGLAIVHSRDEITFVQNLVYYIERAYRIPDYGIWERGEKSNIGYAELNASSIGMAKAALEALENFSLIKEDPDGSRIYVMSENLVFAKTTLEALLPRESITKETDSALLSIIGFPAFTIDDPTLRSITHEKVRALLSGKFGYKRFLLDGHQTAIEDTGRHYYEPEELLQFENIESEWPLFYTYEYLNTLFDGDQDAALAFRKDLARVVVAEDDMLLLPELYYVASEQIKAEKEDPQSQSRVANENLPLTWAQSLFILGDLLGEGHLSVNDIDPLSRHLPPPATQAHSIYVLPLAQSQEVKRQLAEDGLSALLPSEVDEAIICPPEYIAELLKQVGANDKLKLTGRPARKLRVMATSQFYSVGNKLLISQSHLMQQRDFYLTYDQHFLVSRFKSSMRYLHQHWRYEEVPCVTMYITENHLNDPDNELVKLLHEIRAGEIEHLRLTTEDFAQIRSEIRRLQLPEGLLLPSVESPAKTDYQTILLIEGSQAPLDTHEQIVLENETDATKLIEVLNAAHNLFAQVEVLTNLLRYHGLGYELSYLGNQQSVRTLLEDAYQQAGLQKIWSILRQTSALLGKYDRELLPSINRILVHQKSIQIGKAYSEESLIIRPLPADRVMEIIKNYCHHDIRDQVLTQEIIIYLGVLMKSEPELFSGLITLRISYIILLLTGLVAHQNDLSQEDAFDWLMHQPPSVIQKLVRQVVGSYHSAAGMLQVLEALHHHHGETTFHWTDDPSVDQLIEPKEGWLFWRKSLGTINRESTPFYEGVWRILAHAKGVIIGDKLDRRNRLVSRTILSDMTSGERAFELRVENLLNKISAPEYRQVTVEAINAVARFSKQNPDLSIDDHVVFDVIIGHAVRMAFLDSYPTFTTEYHDHKPEAWNHFYALSPNNSTHFIIKALQYLLAFEEEESEQTELLVNS